MSWMMRTRGEENVVSCDTQFIFCFVELVHFVICKIDGCYNHPSYHEALGDCCLGVVDNEIVHPDTAQ